MRRWHWLHMIGGRERALSAYAGDELPPVERSRVASALAECPACRREVRAYERVGTRLRSEPGAKLTDEEAAAFLPEVLRRIDERGGKLARSARPGLREVVWDHPRLSLASALTAVLLAIGATLSQFPLWGGSGATGRNGVEIVSVDVGEDASVMVFQPPGTALKIIWVFEDPSS